MGYKVKVAAVQMDCILDNKEKNLEIAASLVQEASKAGAKLVVLPELFNTGYRTENHDYELAETIPGKTTQWMEELGKRYNTYLVGAMMERGECKGVVYDTSVLVGPDGFIGKYRKIYLWQEEAIRFAHGDAYPVFDVGFAKVGMQICYEAGFPEGARLLTLGGATLITYSAAFGKARSYVWDMATKARALENGLFIVAGNRCGTERNETEFAGNSRIIDPQGQIILEAKDGGQVLVAEYDPDFVVRQRQDLPYLRDYNRILMAKRFAE